MSENGNNCHRETIERYCHIIGKNATVNRIMNDGTVVYECMNRHLCEKNGGCANEKFSYNIQEEEA